MNLERSNMMRFLLVCLVCLVLVLAGCQPIAVPAPAAPAATEEVTEEATEEATEEPAEEAMGETEAITGPFEAVQLILEFAPGSWTPPHSHGGPGLVTVLEGEVTHIPEATGEEMVYAPGEAWNEVAGAVHVAGNDGQENARVAAIFLLPEGASLTTVVEGTSTDDLPPGPTLLYRNSITITESLGNFEAVQLFLEFAPGSWTPPHSHGGPGLVTVIEGDVTHIPEATGEEMVYAPGEAWNEIAGAVHVAGNDGQETARVAALFLLPEGASLTTNQEGVSTDDLPPGPTLLYRTSRPLKAE
jgi:quercetin dioxygenase-like cupin family protein